MKTSAKPTTIDPMLKPSEVEQMVGLSSGLIPTFGTLCFVRR